MSVSSGGSGLFLLPVFDLIIKTRCSLTRVILGDYLVSDDLLESFIALLLNWHPTSGCVSLKTCLTFLEDHHLEAAYTSYLVPCIVARTCHCYDHHLTMCDNPWVTVAEFLLTGPLLGL